MLAPPLAAARDLATFLRARSDEIEQARRLPPDVAARMIDAGLFRTCLPKSLAGHEASAAVMVETIEEIARADASAGWCLMVGLTSSITAAYLDEPTARAIFGDPSAAMAGVFAPRGCARVTEGGFTATGRWPFASGCQHSGWLLGGSVILDEKGPRLTASGAPETRMVIFRKDQVTIHDTWNTAGLCGTGSHDIEVSSVFVPEAYSVSLTTDCPRLGGPLYAFPSFGLLALGVSAVALGIARSAAAELLRVANEKTPFGGKRTLSARPAVQTTIAEIEAVIRSARAFLFDAVGRATLAAEHGGDVPLEERAALRLAACHATASAARAVDLAYGAAGGTSIYKSSPLQRCLRDVHVATQHVMVGPVIQELCGKVLAGVEADTSML